VYTNNTTTLGEYLSGELDAPHVDGAHNHSSDANGGRGPSGTDPCAGLSGANASAIRTSTVASYANGSVLEDVSFCGPNAAALNDAFMELMQRPPDASGGSIVFLGAAPPDDTVAAQQAAQRRAMWVAVIIGGVGCVVGVTLLVLLVLSHRRAHAADRHVRFQLAAKSEGTSTERDDSDDDGRAEPMLLVAE
jgi:hypothetical protein